MGTTNHSSSCGCFEPSVPFPRHLSAACTGLESQAFAMCPGGPQVRVSSMCSSHGKDACTRAWPPQQVCECQVRVGSIAHGCSDSSKLAAGCRILHDLFVRGSCSVMPGAQAWRLVGCVGCIACRSTSSLEL